jgi:hypothetical protein
MEELTITQEKSLTFTINTDPFTYWHLAQIVKEMEANGVPPEAEIRIVSKRDGQQFTANWLS